MWFEFFENVSDVTIVTHKLSQSHRHTEANIYTHIHIRRQNFTQGGRDRHLYTHKHVLKHSYPDRETKLIIFINTDKTIKHINTQEHTLTHMNT